VNIAPGGFAGVDIFFVISGFLITTLLVNEVHQSGTISLTKFYARRAKRILPAAGVVLLFTVALVHFFIPRTRWMEIGGDIIASALYVVNWRLADRSVDYLAEDSVPSPVQHFWSLAVEEQYYLVWPILILLAILLARAIRIRPTVALLLALAVLVTPSFAWSLIQTANSPDRAFFESTTRMWELGLGAGVALASGLLSRLPRSIAIALGWIGLAMIGAAVTMLTTKTPWPGYAAVLPVMGTAAVIMAGFSAGKGGPVSVLGTPPFRWVGGLSYSLYLWHWPLLVIATEVRGELSQLEGLAIVGVSAILAWITFRTIENPLRFSRAISSSPRLALSLGANFTLVGVVGGLIILSTTVSPGTASQPSQVASALGAAVLGDTPRDNPLGAPVDDVGWMTPIATQATADIPRAHADGCQQVFERTEVVTCDYGDPQGPVTVAVVGDSKINQWTPAIEDLAAGNNWNMVTYLKSSCSFTLAMIASDGEPFTQCREWTDAVLERLLADPPDYVVTSQAQSTALGTDGKPDTQSMVDGLRAVWSKLTGAGSTVVVIADNPHPDKNVYECVEENPRSLSTCAFARDDASSAADVQREAVRDLPGVCSG
jgi:peptidoglycan/LPS O-acetylase OafA/YrhL